MITSSWSLLLFLTSLDITFKTSIVRHLEMLPAKIWWSVFQVLVVVLAYSICYCCCNFSSFGEFGISEFKLFMLVGHITKSHNMDINTILEWFGQQVPWNKVPFIFRLFLHFTCWYLNESIQQGQQALSRAFFNWVEPACGFIFSRFLFLWSLQISLDLVLFSRFNSFFP